MIKNKVIFGLHAVLALITQQPDRVERLCLQHSRQDTRLLDLAARAAHQVIRVEWLPREEMDALVPLNCKHQGVVAGVRELPMFDESALALFVADEKQPGLFLVLDEVQDPHNLGACLRTADAMGVQAVIIPKNRAASLTETVAKVACGAAATVPLIPVTNLARTLRLLQELGVWLVGTDATASRSIGEVDLTGNIALVMGGEGQGMRRLTREHCDFLAKIPMVGHVASLNVSVAAAICLYEVQRQRKGV